jgi:hypothetical protein
MDQNQLVVSNGTQHQISPHRQATDVAKLCKDIVTNTAQNIQGRRYVRVEGWQSIANAFGCVASAKDVERTETGFRAIGQVRKMDTGAVIAEAEGFVGDDERTWSKRDEYAKRAMAQTRAISRACRSAFAFVVTMMDAGLETTPAEEVPSEGFADAPHPKPAPRICTGSGYGQGGSASSNDFIEVKAERISEALAEPVRKKQPVAQPMDGADMTEATLIEVQEKHGEGKKGPWTCWKATLEINGRKLYPSTFEADLGAVLNQCEAGDTLMVKLAERPYTDRNGETKKGYDLVFATKANVPAKAEDSEKDIEWGTKQDDSIPFEP